MQNNGLQQRYNNNEELSIHIRTLTALAFVPPHLVVESFEMHIHLNNRIDVLIDYFEDIYIRRFRHNALRAQTRFGIEVWNMFHMTNEEIPRMNNSVEGWHRSFSCNTTFNHPTIWKFLDALKREDAITLTNVAQNIGGHPPLPARKHYVDHNARLVRLVNNFPNIERIQYLCSIAHNLRL